MIKKVVDIRKINVANCNNNIFAITFLATNSKKKSLFSKKLKAKNNIGNKYNFSNDSSKSFNNSNSIFNSNIILKSHRNCHQNKALIAIISFYMIIYT